MKRSLPALFFFLFLSFAVFNASAQVRKIPSEVTEAFKEKYPSATHVEWRDKLKHFSASFELNDEKMEARFDSDGEWLNTEQQIEEDDLPEEVTEGFDKSKYAEWTIDKVYKIELPENIFQYRVQVQKNDVQKKNLLFSSEGRLLKDRITL